MLLTAVLMAVSFVIGMNAGFMLMARHAKKKAPEWIKEYCKRHPIEYSFGAPQP